MSFYSGDTARAVVKQLRKEGGILSEEDMSSYHARIVDPIFDGINTGNHLWGLFLKDYKPAPW
jgi:gamma-glutamyltranspeptidase